MRDVCKLCGTVDELRLSHIIPRFAVRWLRETSATGYLRGKSINLRLQDARRIRLLCEACEQRFGRWERTFAETIFRPYLDDRVTDFEYDEWLLKFVVSLAWRTAQTKSTHLSLEQSNALKRATKRWSRFLLGDARSPGPHQHHFMLSNAVRVADGPAPEGFFTYMLRSFDSTIVNGRTDVIAFTKLPGMVFASYVIPRRPSGWHGTAIVTSGRLTERQSLANGSFAEFLANRTAEVIGDQTYSPKQAEIIERDAMANPKLLESESHRAFLLETVARRERGQSD